MKEITNKNPDWTIQFDEKKHKFIDEKGNQIVSVTGITGIIDKSFVLMAWVAKCFEQYLLDNWDKYPKDILIRKAKKEYRNVSKEACDIGSLIHQWADDWIKGKDPKIPDNEQVTNGIIAFMKWNKDNNIKYLNNEQFIYSKKYNYAGILDAIIEIDKKIYIVDFKSSKGIYKEMNLQLSGYQIAYEEMTNTKIDGRYIIHLSKLDGKFKAKKLENDNKDKKGFLAALNLYNWQNNS